MPSSQPCPGSIICVSPAMAKRGRGATIAASSPIACQSAPSHSIAARAVPLGQRLGIVRLHRQRQLVRSWHRQARRRR